MLARADPQFQPRQGQTDMAVAVARTIATGGMLVVEAGTGVGKTFSYLVPALLSGERVILSTATKALQDQLFARDLPRLAAALGLPVRMALLKGRSSYLCVHRLALARQQQGAEEGAVVRVLAKVERWALTTQTGDLAELSGLDDRSPVIPLVTSTRDNCLGSACPRLRECHLQVARRDALAADVVVINHHLFFADAMVRESGMAELLPSARIVVFDEAHQINETGVQFLGVQLSTGQLRDFSRDLLAAGLQQARGWADWSGLSAAIDRAVDVWRLASEAGRGAPPLRWTGPAPEGVDETRWGEALRQVALAVAQAQEALENITETGPDFERLYERASDLLSRAARFGSACTPDAVRWVDVGGLQTRLVEAPLDIADAMRTRLLPRAPVVQPDRDDGWPGGAAGPGRSWIFTSATLGTDAGLTWFTQRAGLEAATVLRVGSPFDYGAQAGLHVPPDLPEPADPSHSLKLAHWVADAAERIRGRTLVLTTTLRALKAVAEVLRQRFAANGSMEVLVQGEWPKRRLMERFREGACDGQAGCVLVASASFWEGFDVPGDALQLVVIDKLPFPPPGDPVVEARAQRIERDGGRAFQQYFLPEAAVALKQGAGRLIRSETDRGILVIADNRLLNRGYGKRLLSALPPMQRLVSADEFDQALDALTRTSTMDPTGP